jgi:hypothetical protein
MPTSQGASMVPVDVQRTMLHAAEGTRHTHLCRGRPNTASHYSKPPKTNAKCHGVNYKFKDPCILILWAKYLSRLAKNDYSEQRYLLPKTGFLVRCKKYNNVVQVGIKSNHGEALSLRLEPVFKFTRVTT